MFPCIRRSPVFAALCVSTFLIAAGGAALAQHSGANIALHANSHASAAQMGLPLYPGATPYKKDSDSDSAANLGFTFGDFHFGLVAAEYRTSGTPAQVLAFYRKALAQYGRVLECQGGKAVGGVAATPSGLTCSSHLRVNGSSNSSSGIELRAGFPDRYRVVGIDNARAGSTRFGLVYVEVPRDFSGHGGTD